MDPAKLGVSMGFRGYFRDTLELPLQMSSSREKSFLSCLMFCWFTSRRKARLGVLAQTWGGISERSNAPWAETPPCLVHLRAREAGVKLLAFMALGWGLEGPLSSERAGSGRK